MKPTCDFCAALSAQVVDLKALVLVLCENGKVQHQGELAQFEEFAGSCLRIMQATDPVEIAKISSEQEEFISAVYDKYF